VGLGKGRCNFRRAHSGMHEASERRWEVTVVLERVFDGDRSLYVFRMRNGGGLRSYRYGPCGKLC